MKYLKYLILIFSIFYFLACAAEKEPKKEQIVSDSFAHLGVLTSKQNRVKEMLVIYLNELKSFNTDAIIEMTYPKLFTVIQGDIFKQYITSMLNAKDIKVKSYDTNITKISRVTSFTNDTHFAKIDYSSKVKIIFVNPNLYNTESSINFLYDVLIHKYGKENIEINVKERTLSIKRKEHLLAIKEKDIPWKFLGDNKEYRKLYSLILPNEILKVLNKN